MANYYDVLIDSKGVDQLFTYKSRETITPGTRVRVPLANRYVQGVVIRPREEEEFPFAIRSIQNVLDTVPWLSQEQIDLAFYLSRHTIIPGTLMLQSLYPSLFRKRETEKKKENRFRIVVQDGQKLTEKQQEAIGKLPETFTRKEATTLIGQYMTTALTKKGIIIPAEEKMEPLQSWPTLTMEQELALEEIRKGEKQICLLHGVTGSGKTEIFMHLIREQVEKGKQVLLLVPEIALASMMIERIRKRFPGISEVYTGSLGQATKQRIWKDVQSEKTRIVIGTRSAVFLPFQNLGWIIFDEEHDASFQSSSMPAFHAIQAAMFRADFHGCHILLASATPSLESYSRAISGVYDLVNLPVRISGHQNAIRIIDMKEQQNYGGLSLDLVRAIERRLLRKEKTVLLLNRRGYLPTVVCESCREPLLCPDCNIPLSWHKAQRKLVCHICGNMLDMPDSCPHCHENKWANSGYGTERLEETLHELFPMARVVRMDRDSTRKKDAHQKLLESFDTEGDILLGTQMVAKGHDFHEVTLVGVLSIDATLARADYRAGENAYQLIEQAAGRAGRGEESGEVLIQTWNPDHYVIEKILKQNYRKWFAQEMKYRHISGYPPYQYLSTVVIMHPDGAKAYEEAMESLNELRSLGASVLGPAEISMRKQNTRYRLIIRHKSYDSMIRILWRYRNWTRNRNGGFSYFYAVNPMNLEE